MAYQRFDGTMSFLPLRFEAQAMLSEMQKKKDEEMKLLRLKQAEEQKHQTETLWSDLNRMLTELKGMTANREATMSKFFSQTSIPPRPPFPPPDPPDIRKSRQDVTIKAPDPLDFNQSELITATQIPNKRTLRYSCEEIHERMTKGLCIFCEDLDTPGHYNLKHKGSKLSFEESVGDESPDDEKPDEVTVEEISNKSLNMIREKESNLEDVTRPEVSVSQFQVPFASLEPSCRCHKTHNHYESLDVVDKDMCDEPVCAKDGDYIPTVCAKFREKYEDPRFELVCLKQSHDAVENHLDNSEFALTRSSLQHTPTDQCRAPLNPHHNCNDQCHYKREFGNYTEHETEFDRECEEIEDDELKDKQPEDEVFSVDVETMVMNEDEQPLECDDEKTVVTSSILCDRQAVLETEKKIQVSDSRKTNCKANFSGLFSDCKDWFRESEEQQHMSCQLVIEVKVGGHEIDVFAINERADKDDGPNMQIYIDHDVECISRFFRKRFNMCFQEKRDASDRSMVEVEMNSTPSFYGITKDVDAQDRELEASGFTRKEQNNLDKFVKGGLEKTIDEHKDIKTILVLLAPLDDTVAFSNLDAQQLRKQQLDPLLMLIWMIVVPFSTLILMTFKVLELIKDKASKKRKLCKNWWFKYKLNTWLSEAFHFWKYKKQINQGGLSASRFEMETWTVKKNLEWLNKLTIAISLAQLFLDHICQLQSTPQDMLSDINPTFLTVRVLRTDLSSDTTYEFIFAQPHPVHFPFGLEETSFAVVMEKSFQKKEELIAMSTVHLFRGLVQWKEHPPD